MRIHTGKRGRQCELLQLTEKGEAYLRSIGVRITLAGKGGLKHQFWQDKAKKFLEREGNRVIVEPSVKGANTDLAIIKPDGRNTAVEIALSGKNQVENILRDLEHFEHVIVASDTKALVERIRKETVRSVTVDKMKRIEFWLLSRFLGEN